MACWHGYAKITSALLEAGANAQAQNEDGETPLHAACQRGHQECARVLLDGGRCDLDAQDRWSNTALHLAVKRRRAGAAMMLLHAGADFDLLNCVRKYFGHLGYRHTDIVKASLSSLAFTKRERARIHLHFEKFARPSIKLICHNFVATSCEY